MSRLAALRALARQRAPVDEHVTVECPRCDSPMICYTAYGSFEQITGPCPSQCYKTYSEEEYAKVAQDAADASGNIREPDEDDIDE